MKKITFFSIVMLLTMFATLAIKANEPTTDVYIHYYRYDQNYDGWNLWIWQNLPTASEGLSYTFEEDDTDTIFNYGGVVSKISLSDNLEGSTRLGFIVRKNEWEEKDIDNDRFIDITETTEDGILHVYLVEGDSSIGYSIDDPDGPSRFPKFRQSYFQSLTEIYFNATEAVAADDIKIYENDIELTPEFVTIDGTSGIITLANEISFSNTYNIEGTFTNDYINTYAVTYDGIYDSEAFEDAFTYEGDDLGVFVEGDLTTFRLWAPISESVTLNLYDTGTPLQYGGTNTPIDTIEMTPDVNGTFYYEADESLHGTYYTYTVTNGSTSHEVIDPYAKSSGINGVRGLVVDFSQTNPEGFMYNDRPDNMASNVDAIIYELHVRDLTMHSSWTGSEINRGKYLGLVESGTTYNGVTTGFDHIKELGVTHVQLLPFFDYGVVDETRLDDPTYNAFNWGYMPLNFNVLEGTYSKDPYDGLSRISEMKEVVQTFGENDIRINMDVVYNHTGLSADSNFDLIVPGYYHRKTDSGAFSNGSGTGNETASERSMMRKFMIDSVIFWAEEYNISGFRFDLMALHDVETMTLLAEKLHDIDETIMVYGEPWMGGDSPLPLDERADKVNLDQIPNVGAFNDDLRDAVKGTVFGSKLPGFIQGDYTVNNINRIRYGISGGVDHPDITESYLTAQKIWHTDPNKIINYVTAHDNNTLHDKLYMTLEEMNKLELLPDLQKQANAMVLLSQGVSFIHAGDEFLRSKPAEDGDGFDHNSYESPDSVNQMRWDYKARDLEMSVFEYFKDLIAFRLNHESLRMTNASDIVDNLTFVYKDVEGVISYELTNDASQDEFERMLIIHNANDKDIKLKLPTEGGWHLVADKDQIGDETIETYLGGSRIKVDQNATYILYQDQSIEDYNPTVTILLITTGSVIALGGIGTAIYFILKKRKI